MELHQCLVHQLQVSMTNVYNISISDLFIFRSNYSDQLAQYDSTYTLTIWVCSGVTILSGAMIFVLPLLKSQFWMKHRDCCANRSNVVTSVDIMAASH